MLSTEAQCWWVRTRNDIAAERTKQKGTDFYALWPEIKAALDALPDLGPIYRLDPITRQAFFVEIFAEVGRWQYSLLCLRCGSPLSPGLGGALSGEGWLDGQAGSATSIVRCLMFMLLACATSPVDTSPPLPELLALHSIEHPCLPGQAIALDLATDAPYGLIIEGRYAFGPMLPLEAYRDGSRLFFDCGTLVDPMPDGEPAGLITGYRASWITMP